MVVHELVTSNARLNWCRFLAVVSQTSLCQCWAGAICGCLGIGRLVCGDGVIKGNATRGSKWWHNDAACGEELLCLQETVDGEDQTHDLSVARGEAT